MPKFFQSNKENPIHQAKFDLTRNLFTFLLIVLAAIGTLNLVQNDINMYPLLGGAALCLLVLLLLFQFKNYKLAGFIAMIMAAVMAFYNMMVTSNFGHFVDFFWIICMAIFVFFILDRIWGIINLFVNIGIVFTILHLDRTGEIVRVQKEYTDFSEINFGINIVLSGIVFSYLVIKVLGTLRFTEINYVEANMELSKSNEEKTVMLKEIHHRVKNNLQVITSMLRLQLHDIEDENTKHHFTDSINRVSAMATIHEKMYATESLTEIDLESYLDALVSDLISSYAVNLKVETSIHSNVKRIEPKSIVPIALIFNELVSNSIEHGFADRVTGKIEIQAQQDEHGATRVEYRDNGEWKAPKRESSLGVELVEAFTEQLDGTCEQNHSQAGTEYIFIFNKLL
ncbi:MAG: two-component sensor histidine kinase [Arenicella sp.]|jgi:two-component sensor histidine kinase